MAGLEFSQPTTSANLVTPEEAQQVVALWSEEEHEAVTAPSTQDLAEVLNIPEEKVQELLNRVRSQPVEKEKRRGWMWVIAAVLVLTLFLTLSDTVRGFSESRPPAAAQLAPAAAPGEIVEKAAPADVFVAPAEIVAPPKGYSVTFDGYTIQGTEAASNAISVEDSLYNSLQVAMKRMSTPVRANRNRGVNQAEVLRALSQGSTISDVLEYKIAAASSPNGGREASIPILLIDHPTLSSIVREEQERRLLLLARYAASR